MRTAKKVQSLANNEFRYLNLGEFAVGAGRRATRAGGLAYSEPKVACIDLERDQILDYL